MTQLPKKASNQHDPLQVPEHILSQEVQGELVLLDLRTGSYYGLNEVGSHIWSLLLQQKGLDDIVEALGQAYDVSSDRLRADVTAFIQRLVDFGLLSLDHEGPKETS